MMDLQYREGKTTMTDEHKWDRFDYKSIEEIAFEDIITDIRPPMLVIAVAFALGGVIWGVIGVVLGYLVGRA